MKTTAISKCKFLNISNRVNGSRILTKTITKRKTWDRNRTLSGNKIATTSGKSSQVVVGKIIIYKTKKWRVILRAAIRKKILKPS